MAGRLPRRSGRVKSGEPLPPPPHPGDVSRLVLRVGQQAGGVGHAADGRLQPQVRGDCGRAQAVPDLLEAQPQEPPQPTPKKLGRWIMSVDTGPLMSGLESPMESSEDGIDRIPARLRAAWRCLAAAATWPTTFDEPITATVGRSFAAATTTGARQRVVAPEARSAADAGAGGGRRGLHQHGGCQRRRRQVNEVASATPPGG